MKRILLVIMLVFFSGYSSAGEKEVINALRESGKIFSKVAKEVSPSVVMIKVEKEVMPIPYRQPFFSPFQDDFFGKFFESPYRKPTPSYPESKPKKHRETVGQGTGFIISKEGYILTNNHVISDADIIKVNLQDGREFDAKLIGKDSKSDIAVIKIEGKNLPFAKLGKSSDLEVGEWVLALGNPFGLSHTVTAGIVSAKGRSSIGIADYEDFIQTDAAINPGNSGGPLINLSGEVVGINTAIYSRNGGYMGIGFAIPVDMAVSIKDQLIKNGSVARGYLGIIIQDLNKELAESFDVKKGVLISKVQKDSPAEKGGLKPGDVVTEFNGKTVDKVGAFRNMVANVNPGNKASLKVNRKGEVKEISLTLGKVEELYSFDKVAEKFGFYVDESNITDGKGVIINKVIPGSIADVKGLRKGMIIGEVNRMPINDLESFKVALSRGSSNKILLLVQSPEIGSRYLVLESDE